MSCPDGSIGGFPLTLSKNLYEKWSGYNTAGDTKNLETPYDLTIGWQKKIYSGSSFRVEFSENSFARIYIPIYGSSITYNNTIYNALPYMSLVKTQNTKLLKGDATQELIWAFKCPDPYAIPGNKPHLILICRGTRYKETDSVDAFWQVVESSFVSTSRKSNIQSDYNLNTLFPTTEFNVYETCIQVGTINNYRIRVYVIPTVLDIPLRKESESSKCTTVNKLVLNMADVPFNEQLPTLSTNTIKSWDDVKKYIQVQKEGLPNNSNTTPISGPKKNFKCYTIDPDKDIIGDQITIDPATGQPLLEYLREDDMDELQSNTPSWFTTGLIQKYGVYIAALVGASLIIAGLVYSGSIFTDLVYDEPWQDSDWNNLKSASFVLFLCFTAIGTLTYFGVKHSKEGFTDTIQETKDKRCYTSVTGKFIGTKITMLKGPNKGNVIVSYTEDECEKQLGGHHKTESIESGDVEPSSFSGPVGFCYSVDPKVVIPLTTQDYSVSICAPKVIKPPPPPPNLQCFKSSDTGTQLIGKEYKLSKLGIEKYKPLESIISYTQDECDRIGGLYKEIVVPNTYVTDTSIKTNSLTFGFCYKWGTDLRDPKINIKRNFSFICSPSYVP